MKTALVTGASRGIGRAIALELKSKDFSIIGTATSKAAVPLATVIPYLWPIYFENFFSKV